MIFQLGEDGERCCVSANVSADEGSPLFHVNWMRLDEPHMAIDAGTFIEPAIALCSIDANQQHIPLAGIGESGYIEAEGIVTAAVAADVKAVEDNHGIAVRTIELDGEAFSGVFSG